MALTHPTTDRYLVSPASPHVRARTVPPGIVRGGSLAALALLWALLSWSNQLLEVVNPVLLPTPDAVLRTGYAMARDGLLHQHLAASLLRVGQGFMLAAIAALGLAVLTVLSRPARLLLEPLIEFLRPIPPLAFLPMFLVWFGLGETSKVAFITYTTFFPMFITISAGLMQVDLVLLRAAASLGATRRQLLCRVVFPAAWSSIIVGLRLGFSLSIFVIVGAEFITADSGLGYMIMEGRTFFLPAQILLGAFVLGGLGFAVNALLLQLEQRLLPWRDRL